MSDEQKYNITKITDDDGDWYWIPNEILDKFKNDLYKICGRMYMDCPDEFDYFINEYDKFRTLGDSSLKPDYFLKNE